MTGRFQAENAALAYLALRETRPEIPFEAVRSGIEAARLPGRMEIAGVRPPLVLDAAHTPLATERVLESFREIFPERGVLLFGSVAGQAAGRHGAHPRPGVQARGDHDARAPSRRAIRKASGISSALSIPPRSWRGTRPARSTAPSSSREERFPILVTGSFYLLGEIKKALAARDRRASPAVL